jgi:two-component system phosphate regulon response regulator PhoB
MAAPSEQPLVMIVEDDQGILTTLGEELQEHGFRVSYAVTAEEALRRIPQEQPRVIIVDLVLPGIDGLAMLARLKASPQTREIPVMVMAGIGDEAQAERALELGAAAHFIKARDSLQSIVRRLRQLAGLSGKT